MSSSNVRSLERDFAAPRSVSTSESSSKFARAIRKRALLVPKRPGEALLVGLLELPERADPELGEPVGSLRADAGHAARRRGGEAHARLLAAHGDEAGGLAEVAAALGDQPRRPDADRHDDPGRLLDRRHHLAQHAQRLLDAREVGVRLVEPELLNAVEPLADDLPDLRRRLPVGREVGRDRDRVRAQTPRARGGHRRADAELARLVARGRHHGARPGAGDDHRLAGQLRAAQQLDGGVERVAVEVGDDPLWRHANKRTLGVGPRRTSTTAG